jgi:hypothetical protein
VSAAEDEAAYRQAAAWEAARQLHEAQFGSKIEKDVLVIDEDNGRVGKVASVYGLQGAFVHFPGTGRGTAEYVAMDRMSLSLDQDWEPDGGWDE